MNWFRQLFTRNRIYSDLSEEIEQHLPEKVEALIASGISRPQAEQVARREFGNVARVNERGREIWMWPRLESIFADVNFAIRKLRKSSGFSVTAILTLALGIGANVVVFSVLNGLILRPLDVPQPETLFQVVHGNGKPAASWPSAWPSVPVAGMSSVSSSPKQSSSRSPAESLEPPLRGFCCAH